MAAALVTWTGKSLLGSDWGIYSNDHHLYFQRFFNYEIKDLLYRPFKLVFIALFIKIDDFKKDK